MIYRFIQKNIKTEIRALVLFGFVVFFSSCMMMAPMHSASHSSVSERTGVVYTDPVCGNVVENVQNELYYDYSETRYYFHSEDCMNTFKHAPDQYMKPYSENQHHNNWMWIAGGIAMGAMMVLMFL
jgi:YHS domain-containing protein